jgi:hypothetical protein
MIKLQIKQSKEVREFEKAHALSILRLKNCAFELTEDSQYEFIDNEFRIKPDTAIVIEATTKSNDTRSRKARK